MLSFSIQSFIFRASATISSDALKMNDNIDNGKKYLCKLQQEVKDASLSRRTNISKLLMIVRA